MGTTNRAFSPTLHQAKMAHVANNETRVVLRGMATRPSKKQEVQSFTDRIKSTIKYIFSFFGLFRTRVAKPVPAENFKTHFHSDYLCGRRTDGQRQQRKARRAKRQQLIRKRGWA